MNDYRSRINELSILDSLLKSVGLKLMIRAKKIEAAHIDSEAHIAWDDALAKLPLESRITARGIVSAYQT